MLDDVNLPVVAVFLSVFTLIAAVVIAAKIIDRRDEKRRKECKEDLRRLTDYIAKLDGETKDQSPWGEVVDMSEARKRLRKDGG